MSHSHSLDWFNSLPKGFDDSGSYRHMRNFAIGRLKRNAIIRGTIVAMSGEQVAVDEWDNDISRQENTDDHEAIRLIEDRLKHMGLEP